MLRLGLLPFKKKKRKKERTLLLQQLLPLSQPIHVVPKARMATKYSTLGSRKMWDLHSGYELKQGIYSLSATEKYESSPLFVKVCSALARVGRGRGERG